MVPTRDALDVYFIPYPSCNQCYYTHCQCIQLYSTVSHMPEDPEDLEDLLLRRFQALRSTPTSAPSSFRAASNAQAQKAKDEDDELERIAGGYIPGGPSAPTTRTSAGVSEDDELRKRVAGLRGVTDDLEAEDDDDAEVSDTLTGKLRADQVGRSLHSYFIKH